MLLHILDALEMAPATLVTGEFLVAHLTADGGLPPWWVDGRSDRRLDNESSCAPSSVHKMTPLST